MKTHAFIGIPPEDVAATAIRLSRELGQLSHQVGISNTDEAAGMPCPTMRSCCCVDPFEIPSEASLQELRSNLENQLNGEITSVESYFVEAGCDEFGMIFEPRERPVYTTRGKQLLRMLDILDELIAARQAMLDRVAATRALRCLTRA